MITWFNFGGVDTRKYGILVTGTTVYGSPQRQYNAVEVTGGNGTVFSDKGGYKNYDVVYTCEVNSKSAYGFKQAFDRFRRDITRLIGYQELTDSFNPGEIRKGFISAAINPTAMGAMWLGGTFTVTISCKPYRWIKNTEINCILPGVCVGGISTAGALNNTSTKRRTGLFDIGEKLSITVDGISETSYFAVDAYFYGNNGFISKVTGSAERSQSYTVPSGATSCRMSWTMQYRLTDRFAVYSDGKKLFTATANGCTVKNQSDYDMYPKIILTNNVTMTDTVSATILNNVFKVKPFGGQLVIDCENQTVTKFDGTPADSYVEVMDGTRYAYEFPHIGANDNTFVYVPNASSSDPYFDVHIKGMGRTV